MSTSTPLKKDPVPASEPNSTPADESKPISTQIIELVKTTQFAWFVGHLTTLIAGFFYITSFKFFTTSWFNALSYRILYLSVLESFGIILYQTYTQFQLPKLIHDDNFQYFVILALLFLSPVQYSLSVLPFLIFAGLHSLKYFRSLGLPILKSSFTKQGLILDKLGSSIDWFVKSNNEKLVKLSSLIEILNFVVIFFKALYFWRNWVNVLIYALFIKLRYMNSIYIRSYFSKLEVQIDGLVSHPSVPVQLKKLWSVVKSKVKFIGKYDLVNRNETVSDAKKE